MKYTVVKECQHYELQSDVAKATLKISNDSSSKSKAEFHIEAFKGAKNHLVKTLHIITWEDAKNAVFLVYSLMPKCPESAEFTDIIEEVFSEEVRLANP